MLRTCLMGYSLLLASFPVAAADPESGPRRVLLCGQRPDGHPAATHEYVAGLAILSRQLQRIERVEVRTVLADEPWSDGPELLESADCAVLFLAEGAAWVSAGEARLAALRKLAQRRGGLVCLHWAMGSRTAEPVEAFVDLFGGCHGGPDRKYKFLETTLRPAGDPHPITRGVAATRLDDEFYYRLKFPEDRKGWSSVLEADIDGVPETVGWAWQRPDGGRSFGFSGLHRHANWGDQSLRRSVVQGIVWTLDREIPSDGLDVPLSTGELALPPRR